MICEFKDVNVHSFDTGEEYVADCYGVRCDGCGELHIHTEYGCDMTTDPDEIEDDALGHGGFIRAYIGRRELHFCDKCHHPVGFADQYGICTAEDWVYLAAFARLDLTHDVRYLICDGEVIGTSIVTKGGVKHGER